jgi:hypothetical protein
MDENCRNTGGMSNGLGDLEAPQQQQHFHQHHHEAESDADEEVRSLDLPGKQFQLKPCHWVDVIIIIIFDLICHDSSSGHRFAE